MSNGHAPGGPRFYTVAEVAAILRCSQRTITRFVKAGAVPAARVGKRVLVPIESLSTLIGAKQLRDLPAEGLAPRSASVTDATEPAFEYHGSVYVRPLGRGLILLEKPGEPPLDEAAGWTFDGQTVQMDIIVRRKP